MSLRQDRSLPRTPLDVERRYKLQKIKETSEKVEQLEEDTEVDGFLSASSAHAVENRVITEALANKVNVIPNKGLSTNDFTDEYKQKLNDYHTHSNKAVLDSYTKTQEELTTEISASSHSHSNKTVLDAITDDDIKTWNNLALYENGGSTDANTTAEPLILTKVNAPTTDFWYIETLFYGSISNTSNRKQIAYSYKFDAPIYTRYCISGVWSEWLADNAAKKSYNLANYKVSGLTLLRGTCIEKGKRVTINYTGTISIAANTTTVLFNLPAELTPKEIKDFVVFGQNTNNDGYIGYGQISTEGTLLVRFNTAISSYTRFSLTYDLD